jgi:hypothetical protein
MAEEIEDLAPFFDDPCWMCVLLARAAQVGVVLRRGPTNWWRITLWNTKDDAFEGGQWFRGRLYPEKCDVSPNGKLFIYFAGQWRPRNVAKGYERTWTAVSRPPYLTALTLWPEGSTWHGGGVFVDDQTVRVDGLYDSPATHPDHPLGPLKQLDRKAEANPSWDSGWERAAPASIRISSSVKSNAGLTLGRGVCDFKPSRSRKTYRLYGDSGSPDPITSFEAHWADLDQSGRLVATAGGRVLAGRLSQRNELRWRELANLSDDKPARMEAPEWARRW